MNILEIIGAITIFVVAIIVLFRTYRYFVPKTYTWDNCPNDHDTMSRYGAERCDKCGTEF